MGPLLLNPEPAQTCRLYTGTSHGKPVAATAKLPGSQLASHSHQMHTHYGTLNCPLTDLIFFNIKRKASKKKGTNLGHCPKFRYPLPPL